MSSVSHDLYRLIRKIAGNHETENVTMMVCEVIAVSLQTLTITVKDITGKSFTDADVLFSTLTNEEMPNSKKEFYNSIYGDETNSMIYTDVALMSGGNIDNGFLIIPKVGSQVTVLITDRQNPEVINYTEIEAVQIISDDTITTVDGTGLVVSTKDAKSLYRFQNEQGGSSGQPGCYMSVNNNGTVYTQNETSFDLKVNNGAEIKADTKITLKNQTDDLKTIFIDLIDTLKTGVDTGGYSFNPATVALLNAIETRINNLLQ